MKTKMCISDNNITLFLNPLAIMQSMYDYNIVRLRSMIATNVFGFWDSVADTDPRWSAMAWIREVPLWQEKSNAYHDPWRWSHIHREELRFVVISPDKCYWYFYYSYV